MGAVIPLGGGSGVSVGTGVGVYVGVLVGVGVSVGVEVGVKVGVGVLVAVAVGVRVALPKSTSAIGTGFPGGTIAFAMDVGVKPAHIAQASKHTPIQIIHGMGVRRIGRMKINSCYGIVVSIVGRVCRMAGG